MERFVIYQNISTLRMQDLFFWIGGLRWDTSSKILTEISFNRRQKTLLVYPELTKTQQVTKAVRLIQVSLYCTEYSSV